MKQVVVFYLEDVQKEGIPRQYGSVNCRGLQTQLMIEKDYASIKMTIYCGSHVAAR